MQERKTSSPITYKIDKPLKEAIHRVETVLSELIQAGRIDDIALVQEILTGLCNGEIIETDAVKRAEAIFANLPFEAEGIM